MRTKSAKPNEHFGNPWSEGGYAGTIKTSSVAEAANNYKEWLLGNKFQDVKPEQKAWILKQINQGKLDGAKLLYSAKLMGRGQGSHAISLAEVVEQLRSTQPSTKPTVIKPGVDARPQVNPKIKQETDALVEAINELRNQGKDIVYVKGGIGNDLVKSIPGKPAPATQSFIYLSEQLLKANILNPELAKVVNDPQNETSESGKDIIQKVQKDIFGISDDDVSDNLLFCIADL
jgi:hypothetical protein